MTISDGILTNSYQITLTPIEPIRVGGADNPLSDADNAVAVLGGRPCIPGATIKGALRSQIERFLFVEYFKNGQWTAPAFQPCLSSAGRISSAEQELIDRSCYRRGGKGCSLKMPRDNGGMSSTALTICPACYLLGAMGLTGFVSVPFLFSDAYPEELYSSRIDRARHTVATGANRSYETMPPDTPFVGTMEVILKDSFLGWELGKKRPLKESPNADGWVEKTQLNQTDFLNRFVLDRLRSIDRIGGFRSKGCGKVKIEVKPVNPD